MGRALRWRTECRVRLPATEPRPLLPVPGEEEAPGEDFPGDPGTVRTGKRVRLLLLYLQAMQKYYPPSPLRR